MIIYHHFTPLSSHLDQLLNLSDSQFIPVLKSLYKNPCLLIVHAP